MIGPEFASCSLKIARAEEHFNALKAELLEWNRCNPYSVLRKKNADGSRHSLIVQITVPAPVDRWSLIAGDCVHNLRSALDHLVYALAVRDTGANPPTDFNKLQFPITISRDDFAKQRWRIAPLSPVSQALIERAQPYNRRNPQDPPILSVLNEFDNADKHRLINVAFALPGSGEVRLARPSNGAPPVIHWVVKPIRSGAEIMFFIVDPPQPEMDYHFDVSFHVTVRHVPGANGSGVSPLVEVLGALLAEAKRIVTDGSA